MDEAHFLPKKVLSLQTYKVQHWFHEAIRIGITLDLSMKTRDVETVVANRSVCFVIIGHVIRAVHHMRNVVLLQQW